MGQRQSDLDRELLGEGKGLADLNIVWALAERLPPSRGKKSRKDPPPAQVLRSRFTPGGMIRRSYEAMSRDLHVSTNRARYLVSRSLHELRRALDH